MSLTLANSSLLQSPVTISLFFSILFSSVYSFFNKAFLFKLLLHPVSVVKKREYYRLVTADFVHNNFAHLAINLLMIVIYCLPLEQYLNSMGRSGSLQFALVYSTSCLSGSIFTTIRHKKDLGFSSAGASGSVMGCLFSYTLLKPNRTAFYLPVLGAVNNLFFGLICIAGIVVYQQRSKNDLIDHEVHFFGSAGGIIITLILFSGIILK